MGKVTIDVDWLGRNYLKITIVILLLLVAFQCNSNHELTVASASDKKEAKTSKKNALEFEKIAVNLAKKEILYKDTIKKQKENDNKYQKQITENKVQVVYLKQKVKDFKPTEIANWVKDYYKAQGSQVFTTNLGTVVKDTIGKAIITDLIDRDGLKAENGLLNQRIEVKDSTINTYQNYVDLKSKQIEALQSANSENKKATEYTENALKNTEKAFRKEKNKNLLVKTALGVAIAKIIYSSIKK